MGLPELPEADLLHCLTYRRTLMSREAWIRNVLKFFPEKTKEEVGALYDKISKNETTTKERGF